MAPILCFSSREVHERHRSEYLPRLDQEIEGADRFEGRGDERGVRGEDIWPQTALPAKFGWGSLSATARQQDDETHTSEERVGRGRFGDA